NYPNPFNPATTIAFGLDEPSDVTLAIYDAAGRLVRMLVDRHYEAGRFEEPWDGTVAGGLAAASGVYFYRLEAESFRHTKKMVLLK
ncbi:MAG: T9SS type A sorting domain-containing protein, partial [Candidatus Krumholzibacteria bacterium]|nr:T9SS type A sorting domain-containing protein [Candidatus Krumholzibacteria bacterium]